MINHHPKFQLEMSAFEVTTGLITLILKAASANAPVVDSDFEGKSAFFHVAMVSGPELLSVMLVHEGKLRKKRRYFQFSYL